MKAIIVYESIHHGNTEKVARAIAEALGADLKKASKVEAKELTKYDLIGFGSGIYYGRHHKNIFDLLKHLPYQKGRKVFIFSTSGIRKLPLINNFNKPLEKKLKDKGFEIVGIFDCRGWDTYPFIVKPFGGISKGRPNSRDIEDAKEFAERVKKHFFEKQL